MKKKVRHVKILARCGMLRHAAACFKTPMCSSKKQVLRHAAACCGMLRHAAAALAWLQGYNTNKLEKQQQQEGQGHNNQEPEKRATLCNSRPLGHI